MSSLLGTLYVEDNTTYWNLWTKMHAVLGKIMVQYVNGKSDNKFKLACRDCGTYVEAEWGENTPKERSAVATEVLPKFFGSEIADVKRT